MNKSKHKLTSEILKVHFSTDFIQQIYTNMTTIIVNNNQQQRFPLCDPSHPLASYFELQLQMFLRDEYFKS